jgi:phosphoglycolate phosphatase-like HAD superfamily hydrolase
VSGRVAVDLDGALGDTHALWSAFVEDAARRFRAIAELNVDGLPADRASAADELDRWAAAGVGDWRLQLTRFAEEHAPVYLRTSPRAAASLRALAAAGATIGVYTDAPEELARVALEHLGAARRVSVLVAGAAARERLLERLGDGAATVESEDALELLARAG